MRHTLPFLLLAACGPASLALDSEPKLSPDSDSSALQETDAADVTPLSERVTEAGFLEHMQALDAVAQANGGNRAFNTPGYEESLDYIEGQLAAVGYEVERVPFTQRAWTQDSDPALDVLQPEVRSYVYGLDIDLLRTSGVGDVTGALVAIDLTLPPGQENSSTSACEASDFDGFQRGSIALIQRGGCSFRDKVVNAEDAGAGALIIFNEGQSGRQGLFEGTLNGTAELPALAATFQVGQELTELLAQGPVTLRVAVDGRFEDVESHNLVAQWPGQAGASLMLGAHLDSVSAGAGINDNGSGSAALLEVALRLAELPALPERPVRFGWWGAEEVGLVGSTAYVAGLSRAEIDDIYAYLNFDMIASPNGAALVYDGDGDETGSQPGPAGSAQIEGILKGWLDAKGQHHNPTTLDGRSDYLAFWEAGIPNGGIFTGAEENKRRAEAEGWGGEAGEPYDPCYHRACDGMENIDMNLGVAMLRAIAHSVDVLAVDEETGLEGPPGPRADWSERLPKQGHDWRR